MSAAPIRVAPDAPPAARRAAAEGDLCYAMQKWPRVLYKREAEQDGLLKSAEGMRKEGTWPAFTRELFGRLYGMGTSRMDDHTSGAEWAAELHDAADAVPEWKALGDRVRGDAWRCALGAGQAAAVLASKVPELPEENQEALENEAAALDEMVQGGRVNAALMEQRGELQRRIAAARNKNEAAVEQMRQNGGFATRSALREAAQKAEEAIQAVDDGLQGLGCGSEATPFVRRQLAAQLATDERIRQIAVIAGRLRMQAARKQRTKTKRHPEEVKSIKQGDDIRHLLASELGLLAQDVTKPFLVQRVSEKRALQYELGGTDTKARGPIIFCIDNSGSMSGARDIWSKAVALAMMEIARIQNRAFACYIFNAQPQHRFYFDAGQVTFEKILEMLSVTPGGGTDIEIVLNRALDTIAGKPDNDGEGGKGHNGWPHGPKADVVLVTDGEDPFDPAAVGKRFKELEASLYVMGIATQLSKNGVGSIADEVVSINDLELTAANKKLDGVFSI